MSHITMQDLNTLSLIEGMYKDIVIKRSGLGLVLILSF